MSNRPPLRQYLLDGEFFVGAAIACTLTKLALRYLDIEDNKEKQNVGVLEISFLTRVHTHLKKETLPPPPLKRGNKLNDFNSCITS